MTAKVTSFRIKLLGIFLAFFLVLIVYRLYQVQIVNGESFRERADNQYVRTSTSDFDRGSIYIKDGNGVKFPVASVASGYLLAINPTLANLSEDEILEIYNLLNPEAKEGFQTDTFLHNFNAKLADKDDTYEEITEHLTEKSALAIKDLNYDGVNVYGQRWRYYPNDEMLSHLIGFTSYSKDDEVVGTYGLERQYEDQLGRGDSSIFTNFFAEAFMTAKDVVSDSLASDLYLTIDRSTQIELEKTLLENNKEWHSKRTSGIVLDPATGEVVAMASVPNFDLNHFSSVDDSAIYSNPLVENVYEMGSIMKPLTMAYAIDSGAVTRNTTYNDTGKLTVDESTISNYDGQARGVVAVQEILNQSLNIGSAFLVREMGKDTFKDYFKKTNFNHSTGIDLPNEAEPLTSSLLSSPRQIEPITASFGQGFAVSPIAMVRSLALLANHGRLPQPYVVERIQHELGTWTDMRSDNEEQVQVVSEATADTVTDMLVTVVDEALSGGDEALRNYSIAAKTGTAQIANTTGTYREDAYLHTFFGYFPAYNPKYLIFLMSEEPVGARYASQTLTDPFMSLTKFLINYQNLEPDR